jgi:hypothetical protein
VRKEHEQGNDTHKVVESAAGLGKSGKFRRGKRGKDKDKNVVGQFCYHLPVFFY